MCLKELSVDRLSGYPPFSDERKDMDLPKQIMGGHYTFPAQYWKDISEDGNFVISRTFMAPFFCSLFSSVVTELQSVQHSDCNINKHHLF